MLSDRSYMRDAPPERRTTVLGWLIAAIVAGFVLQSVLTRFLGAGELLDRAAALSPGALRSGFAWTLFTYGFLHDPENLLHILGNLLGLYFLGRALLPVLGPRRFLWLYAGSVVLGGACWAAVNWHSGAVLIGASAGVMSLLIVFACLNPDQEMTFLLFFILPVTMKPKHVACAAVGIDLLGCLFYEVLGSPSPFGFAHSAHLGGMAAGWLYYRFFHGARLRPSAGRREDALPRWLGDAPPARAADPAPRGGGSDRGHLRAEVDRILDKINSRGFGALTDAEKRLLDEARDLLSRR